MRISEYINKNLIIQQFRFYFSLKDDLEQEELVLENIRKDIVFRGANLWVLILAVIIASVGLNVNSTAVIIGAMLVSPLMGPILGIGTSVGINDMDLLKRSLRNLAVATLFSVLAATLYFMFTPLNDIKSELLARTSPTIYDVFIALAGGLAGIFAICTKGKGSVIIGVSIATALMPPLCTAGFGLATANWWYALGALYLYFINAVFISISTFLGVRIMGFKRKQFNNAATEKKVSRYIIATIIITICPAIYLTYGIVKETIYTQKANTFVSQELVFDNSQIVERKVNYQEKDIQVVLLGEEVPQDLIANAKKKLENYGLQETNLSVIQGSSNTDINLSSLRSMVLEDFYKNSEEKIARQREVIDSLQQQLHIFTQYTSLNEQLTPELRILFPQARSIALGYSVQVDVESVRKDTLLIALMQFEQLPDKEDKTKIHEWLKARTGVANLQLLEQKIEPQDTLKWK